MEPSHLFLELLYHELPNAVAEIFGSRRYPSLRGQAKFYVTYRGGLVIEIEVIGLPDQSQTTSDFYPLQIHEYGDCSGDFENVGDHLNPPNTRHPFHAGDLPALMSNNGYAWMVFYDDRITLQEIIGRSIVIQDIPADFCYPASDDSEKIACGVIIPIQ